MKLTYEDKVQIYEHKKQGRKYDICSMQRNVKYLPTVKILEST